MSKRGRPPTPRGVLSFETAEWSVPEALLLDTSVVVEALLPSEANHRACAALFRQVAESECTVIFNELLETELCEAVFRLALKERHGKNWRAARYDGRMRRRAGRLLEDEWMPGANCWTRLVGALRARRGQLRGAQADARTRPWLL